MDGTPKRMFLLESRKHVLAAILFTWVAFLHLSGLSLFTRGFLLNRHALSTKSSCDPSSTCTLPPTHNKAVVLIIDALRFDFVSPHPPQPASEYYHNILTLPRELSASRPHHSFLFEAYSDPPTATLQRIKGITTGSLPTFVDIGSSFSASTIEEDSLISQFKAAGKSIAFAGDATWMTAFSNPFAANMSFPYDSFNVEDLHTVDEGVISHLFPLLDDNEAGWDVFIGHFLGVDHVGHRVGPDHPTMRTKLKQMDTVLRNVVSSLDDDTLLIVMGDHGMDPKGDHGGDGDLETSSALWVYSKSKPLSSGNLKEAEGLFKESMFPGAPRTHRAVQQIDLVPTISLLLGLPIPFNNLGSIIPELFLHPSTSRGKSALAKATQLNDEQVMAYLQAYRAGPSGSELDGSWAALQASYASATGKDQSLIKSLQFTRLALSVCRSMWAQFNGPLMVFGLGLLFGAALSLSLSYALISAARDDWEVAGQALASLAIKGGVVGSVLGAGVGYGLQFLLPDWFTIRGMDLTVGSAALISELFVLCWNVGPAVRLLRTKSLSRPGTLLPIVLLILHSLAFTSNSFTIWEDRLVPYFLVTLLVPSIISSFSSPSSVLRPRILAYSGIAAVCVRLISISTVCREEQQPNCGVTFYSSSTRPLAPLLVVLAVVPVALGLPSLVRRFLSTSKSDKGAAPFLVEVVWRIALLGGTTYWLVEWAESAFGPTDAGTVDTSSPKPLGEWTGAALIGRTLLARIILGLTLVGNYVMWWNAPLNIEIIVDEAADAGKAPTKRVTVIGFANSFGSTYLLFVLPFFAVLWIATQLSGQVALALGLVTILCYVELVDSQRDSRALVASFENALSPESALDDVDAASSSLSSSIATQNARSPTFAEPVFFSILALALFYGTGHQAVLSSIQWKTAFVGFPILTYPWSPMLVSLNTFGSFALCALALPLLSTWAISPSQRGKTFVLADTVRLALGLQVYFTTLLCGAALSAAVLRRHLMVWKIFAPRFMLAGVIVLVVDAALALAIFMGGMRTIGKVRRVFGSDI